jgi:DNA-binding response OmpR family regulator
MNVTIMIVDDEPFMLRLIEASLRKGGYHIESFRDAESALKAAAAKPPKLFVLDLLMPGMSGMEALRQVKESSLLAPIPVILLTSKGRQLTKQEVLESGAALYLTKPFSPTELLNEARRLIEAA